MKSDGRFGKFGGIYVPEILFPALEQLEEAFLSSQGDPEFTRELGALLKDYAGRPTPLYLCRRLCADTDAKIYLKREDLLHGGAHKTNQVLGQALLARRMCKKRLIAETGAGQHGVATAIVGALMGFPTRIYMGAKDVERQALNVFRMRLMGADVISVEGGSKTLKDAINEAMRDWAYSYEDTHYLLGTAAGPHPFPTMVREFQRVIGCETRQQILDAEGKLPDAVIACVGGGSNAIGIFKDFEDDKDVALIGVEAAGLGIESGKHGATLAAGRPGVLHGAMSYVLEDDVGWIDETHSVSAGLDYPAVGAEHSALKESGRATYTSATDEEAMAAFAELSRTEGIIPALESAHAIAEAMKMAKTAAKPITLVVNLSGRGDKDMDIARAHLGELDGS